MKRLLALVLVLASVAVAEAKVLLVNGRGQQTDAALQTASDRGRAFHFNLIRAALDRTGVDYRIANPTTVKTEYCRTGVMVWPDQSTETFDAVIHANFEGRGAVYSAGYRADSLTLSRGTLPLLVPQLYLGDNWVFVDAKTRWASGTSGTSCSTGVSTLPTTNTNDGYRDVAGAWFQPGYDEAVIAGSYTVGAPLLGATDGGLRVLVSGGRQAAIGLYQYRGSPPSWADSMLSRSADTAVVWVRPMSHVANSQPNIFCWYQGNEPCTDSAGAQTQPCEGEPAILLTALAHLDSVTGGDVFGSSTKLPLKLGLVIEGGFARSGRRHYVGVSQADSAALIATIDSLIAFGAPPAVLAVEVDSIETYPNEKAWWADWVKLRYSPYTRVGVADSAANSGAASFTRPVDIWGRYRTRASYGDGSAAGADTSRWALLRGGFWKVDSIFPEKRSGFLVAPGDDWSSKLSTGLDSTVGSIAMAGGKGLLVNGQSYRRGIGFPQRQGRYPLADFGVGRGFNFLAHSGYSVAGGTNFYDIRADSVGPDFVPTKSASRWYFPSTGAADVPVAYAAWGDTLDADRLAMVQTRVGSTQVVDQATTSGAVERVLVRQYVSVGLAAQTITGTVKGQAKFVDVDELETFTHTTMSIRVVSSDGTVVRGTLLALGEHVASNPFAVSPGENRKLADGDALTSLATEDGDRLVVDIGFKQGTIDVVAGGINFGDVYASDLPEDETSSSNLNAWIEFSTPILLSSFAYDHAPYPMLEIHRAWHGLLFEQSSDYGLYQHDVISTGMGADKDWENVNKPRDDRLYGMRRANVVRIGPNDLSGDPTAPARNAYWQIKSLSSAMRIINRMAGRTIVEWDYPENINPN